MPMTVAEKSARHRSKDVDEYRRKKKEYAKTPEQKAKRTQYMQTYRAKNRERMNEQARKSHSASLVTRSYEYRRNSFLKTKYGITLDDYKKMLEDQNGLCLICGIDTPRGNKSWHVDHCHKTGKVRGLLCNYCNPRLGFYETYKEKIETYLKERG
jgi:hypothetical protein